MSFDPAAATHEAAFDPTYDVSEKTPAQAAAAEQGVSSDTVRAAQRRTVQLEREIAVNPGAFRVLTGDRPTGALHVGHLLGTLDNRVRLQNSGVQVVVVIADFQVITDRDVAGDIRANVRELMLDYLAVGLDPQRSLIFAHSAVSALNQLMLPFLSLVSVAELERNPTVKDEARAARRRGHGTTSDGGGGLGGLLLTYPVHQAADILFCHGNLVPVGRDQLPHIELTRTIARRFNDRYAGGAPVFPEPDALLSSAPTVLGTDGGKMSKSSGNVIAIGADEDTTAAVIRGARTDSERVITYDPIHRPEVASLLAIAAFCQDTTPEVLAEGVGSAGAARLKSVVTDAVNEYLRPIRRRRQDLAGADDYLRAVLNDGNEAAAEIAERTLADVRDLMGMTY